MTNITDSGLSQMPAKRLEFKKIEFELLDSSNQMSEEKQQKLTMDKKEISDLVNSLMSQHKNEQEQEFKSVKDELKEIKMLLSNLQPKENNDSQSLTSQGQKEWEPVSQSKINFLILSFRILTAY